MTFDGYDFQKTPDRSIWLNAIPIAIPYQLDIYTRYQQEADEYVRNLIFNIVNFPRLQITVPYLEQNSIKDCNIRLEENVTDNSAIPERLIPGQFTRLSLGIYIDDAYLYDVRARDNYKICADNVNVNFKE